jgi:hypothetical protein
MRFMDNVFAEIHPDGKGIGLLRNLFERHCECRVIPQLRGQGVLQCIRQFF